MDYLVAAQPVSPRVRQESLERFGLFLKQRWRLSTQREGLTSIVADESAHPAISRVGQKSNRP